MRGKNKKIILPLAALVLVLSIALPMHFAHAATPGCSFPLDFSVTVCISSATAWAFYIVGFIASMVFAFGGFLTALALELNSGVATLPVVRDGWTIVLNLTNLAFVLGIIWIAIATIVRSQTYGMKQILWKLIVAAVLVNFSLVIAGFFLDFSGIITDYFVDKSSPENANFDAFATQLAASMQPQSALSIGTSSVADFQKKLSGLPPGATAGDVDLNAGLLNVLVNLFFGVMFTIVGAIVFLGIATMLLVRFLFIAILLILAPVVWLGWVFPALGKYWDEWWSNFMKWVFFPPVTTFFLYLSIRTAITGSAFITTAASTISKPQDISSPGDAFKAVFFDSIGNLAKNLIIMALMVGGLIAAERSGIAFAGAFKGMATGVGKWTVDKAKASALWGKNRSTLAFKGAAESMAKTMQEGKGNRFTNLGRRFVVGQVAGAQKAQRDAIDAKVKAQLAIPPAFRVPLAELTTEDIVANALAIAQDKTANGSKLKTRDRDLAEKYGYEKEIIKKAGFRLDNRNQKDTNGKDIENTNPEYLLRQVQKAAEKNTELKTAESSKELFDAQQALKNRSEEIMKDWSPEEFAAAGQWIQQLDFNSGEGDAIIQAITQTATGDKLNKILNEIKKGDAKLALRNSIKIKIENNEKIRQANEANKNNLAWTSLPVFRVEKSLVNVLENFGQVGTEGTTPPPAAPAPAPAPGAKP